MKNYFVYMLASENNNALYTGITNDLERRLHEHRNGLTKGFTKKYQCKKLVHYEAFDDPENAIAREKDIKGWVRKRKNELIEKNNSDWKDLSGQWQPDPSGQALQDDAGKLTPQEWQRYERHLTLPGITPAHQKHLKQTRILVIGAGGLGAPSLPYLAGAGIGHITIMDHDVVDVTNLHRQTIFTATQTGQNKATLAAAYLKALNPHCDITAIEKRLGPSEIQNEEWKSFDLILDGSDNFETKILLNKLSIEAKTPLISASVNRFESMIGIFAGYLKDGACYNCLFPQIPQNACNCNEAGVLGTSAGLAGLYQAHLALCYLLGIGDAKIGTILSLNCETFRIQNLQLEKDPLCKCCAGQKAQQQNERPQTPKIQNEEVAILARTELDPVHLIIDVREPHEVFSDPIREAINIPLASLPLRLSELPKNKMLALVCAANIRSRVGAEMLRELGFDNVCILDKARAA